MESIIHSSANGKEGEGKREKDKETFSLILAQPKAVWSGLVWFGLV